MTIYPDIFIAIRQVKESNGKLYYHTLLDTAVRKQHTDGKWYLNRFIKRRATEDVLGAEMCIKEFQIELYHWQLFGKVSPDSRDLFGNPMQPLDEDQRSEEERLKELYKLVD